MHNTYTDIAIIDRVIFVPQPPPRFHSSVPSFVYLLVHYFAVVWQDDNDDRVDAFLRHLALFVA